MEKERNASRVDDDLELHPVSDAASRFLSERQFCLSFFFSTLLKAAIFVEERGGEREEEEAEDEALMGLKKSGR